MSQQKTHDLYDFMRQISAEMAAEYSRIHIRAAEDPGTAGDQTGRNYCETGFLATMRLSQKVEHQPRGHNESAGRCPRFERLVSKETSQ